MSPAIVSGIVTGDVSVSYWPIFSPFSRKLFGPVSFLLKRRMTVQVWNFVSSFILFGRRDKDHGRIQTSNEQQHLLNFNYILRNIWWCMTLEALIESTILFFVRIFMPNHL